VASRTAAAARLWTTWARRSKDTADGVCGLILYGAAIFASAHATLILRARGSRDVPGNASPSAENEPRWGGREDAVRFTDLRAYHKATTENGALDDADDDWFYLQYAFPSSASAPPASSRSATAPFTSV